MKHRAECSPFFVCVFLRSHGVPRFCVTLVSFSVTWVPFGLHFGSIWEPFPPKVVPNGALWIHFSCQKTDWGAKGAPRGATPVSNSPFWTPFGGQFSYIFVFLCKNKYLKHAPFFLQFWVALSAPGDGLICNPYTPVQSKHTFQFLHFSLKKFPKEPQMRHFLGRF